MQSIKKYIYIFVTNKDDWAFGKIVMIPSKRKDIRRWLKICNNEKDGIIVRIKDWETIKRI
jgi:hypothetical protein